MSGKQIFVSYAHEDSAWCSKLTRHLNVLAKQHLIEVWLDQRIRAGSGWLGEIQRAIASAHLAILLISADFLSSDFILQEEVPLILERHSTGTLAVVPVLVRPCAWRAVPWLSPLQIRSSEDIPLSARRGHRLEAELSAIAEEVLGVLWEDASEKTGVRAGGLKRMR